ncbi:hypothetical protein [Vulcanisaeta thermophila]|uniref:hypothetical protein n=1 Tax=Vulcanisaeta thermophila TaxID=867917 RepID=UPI000A0460BD|nr:hypothetical protein [Vulcanisaeta thermophila]
MIFNFFSPAKSAEKRYKRYVGKPLTTTDGKVIGIINSIKLSKHDLKPVSLVIRSSDGSIKEINITGLNVKFLTDKVVVEGYEDGYTSIINTLKNEASSIKERLRDIMDKLNKLSDLLLQGGIKEDLYRDIRERLERERMRWIRMCNDKVSSINDLITEIDRKITNAERRRSELLVKQVVNELSPDEESELTALGKLIDQLRGVRTELVSLKLDLERECY